jgi:hypothetical protein
MGTVRSASNSRRATIGGVERPTEIGQPSTWQGKRVLGPNLYYSRARIWSADLGSFLQPDQYAYLRGFDRILRAPEP